MIFTMLREYAFYGMTAISIIRLRPLAPFSFLHASRKSQVVLLRKESRSCGKTMHVSSWTLEGNTNLIYHINAGFFYNLVIAFLLAIRLFEIFEIVNFEDDLLHYSNLHNLK